MRKVGVASGLEDFISRLLRLIRNKQQDKAIEEIVELKSYQQLETLNQLALEVGDETLHLRFELAVATTIALDSDLIRARARLLDPELIRRRDSVLDPNLDLARALAHAVAVSLALARTRARDIALVRHHARDLTLDRDRARDLDRALDRAHDLAVALASDFTSDTNLARDSALARARILELALDRARDFALALALELVSDMAFLMNATEILIFIYTNLVSIPSTIRERIDDGYSQKLADALDECLYLQQLEPSYILDTISQVLQRLIVDKLQHVTLEGVLVITPDALADTIAPYLQALNDFLRVHSQLSKSEFQGLRIVQIHNEVPKVEFSVGFGDAIRAFIELFQFGKRKQEAELRKLQIVEAETLRKVQEKEAELRIAQIELQKQNLRIEEQARLQSIVAEASQKIIAANKEALEFEQKRIELEKELTTYYYEKASDYVEKYAPHLSVDERIPLIIQLADAMKRMGVSEVTLRLGWHDTPRPPTLPK